MSEYVISVVVDAPEWSKPFFWGDIEYRCLIVACTPLIGHHYHQYTPPLHGQYEMEDGCVIRFQVRLPTEWLDI